MDAKKTKVAKEKGGAIVNKREANERSGNSGKGVCAVVHPVLLYT